jgi:hypothetical protein
MWEDIFNLQFQWEYDIFFINGNDWNKENWRYLAGYLFSLKEFHFFNPTRGTCSWMSTFQSAAFIVSWPKFAERFA